jgi:hypothetical protein
MRPLATVATKKSCANTGSQRDHAMDRSTRNQRPFPPSGDGGNEEGGSSSRNPRPFPPSGDGGDEEVGRLQWEKKVEQAILDQVESENRVSVRVLASG